ncbi:uncharacterized protein LOC117337612 [Pecten maximus]|uniref:uncharacterized protein LOC117337612 n=1 Tax=Pecten maximus TaxID=6579 RepID=UPI001458E272|nr:uncharacterized protein LOC117337612 [Pecten maximus]XP_033754578.1 uncharacterized protein LOC117337612 [Pecten maximus]
MALMPVQDPLNYSCDCKERDPSKLKHYIDSNNRRIGWFCTKCGVESLVQEYITGVNSDHLSRRQPRGLEQNAVFQVQCPKTEVDLRHYADILKPGDHVTWHRPYIIWHHAIVSEINARNNTIGLIHWTKTGDCIRIINEIKNVGEGQLYRIDYSEVVNKENPFELVLARARSRINDTGYELFSDNCESFATFCKCGVVQSHQLAWLKGKVTEFLGHNVATHTKSIVKSVTKYLASASINLAGDGASAIKKIVPAELVEKAVKGSNWVGAGVVFAIETIFVTYDLAEIYQKRKKGKLTRHECIEYIVQRVTEGFVSAGVAVVGSVGLEILGCCIGAAFGPVGVLVGGFTGEILGGILFYGIGKAVGTSVGKLAGKSCSKVFKQNDRAVDLIKYLHPGDHIVTFEWFLHPRCHAIVVGHDGNKILVIRNTHERGVVKDWMPFRKPLYKVQYGHGECYEPDVVLANAQSRLGEENYDLITYNCKTFAMQCKSDFP